MRHSQASNLACGKRTTDADMWWDRPDIDKREVSLLIQLYNSYSSVHGLKYQYRASDPESKPWYHDFVSIYRTIKAIGAKPREFIGAQFAEYKPPFRLARPVPTPRQIAAPAAVDRWKAYRLHMGIDTPEASPISPETMVDFCKRRMQLLTSTNHIEEDEVLKDPSLVMEFSKDFLLANPIFQGLMQSNYYEENFGIPVQAILR